MYHDNLMHLMPIYASKITWMTRKSVNLQVYDRKSSNVFKTLIDQIGFSWSGTKTFKRQATPTVNTEWQMIE